MPARIRDDVAHGLARPEPQLNRKAVHARIVASLGSKDVLARAQHGARSEISVALPVPVALPISWSFRYRVHESSTATRRLASSTGSAMVKAVARYAVPGLLSGVQTQYVWRNPGMACTRNAPRSRIGQGEQDPGPTIRLRHLVGPQRRSFTCARTRHPPMGLPSGVRVVTWACTHRPVSTSVRSSATWTTTSCVWPEPANAPSMAIATAQAFPSMLTPW